MKTTVGVLFGCPSVEHEVAVISALQAMQSLDEEKYDIFPIYISKEGDWYWGDALFDIENFQNLEDLLNECEKIVVSPNAEDGTVFLYPHSLFNKRPLAVIDVFMPITHGAYGEDGAIQGFLEMTGIPYTGPSVLGASVGMDKVVQKALCKMIGVPVLDCFWFEGVQWGDGEEEIVAYIERKFGYPVVVKPANLGSSIGISIAECREDLVRGIEEAVTYSSKVLVERAITNLRELNISVLGDAYQAEVSEIEEPVTAGEILSFADKYLNAEGGTKSAGMAGSKRRIPAEIPDRMAEQIREYALDAFYCMEGSGVWRMDFFLDEDTDRIYFNEVNTIPGSLAYYLWEPKGLSFPRLLDRLIQIALRGKQRKKNMVSSFRNNLLAQGGFQGIK